MKSTDSISTLAGSLAKAQAMMTGAKKDAKNPHFRSDYATLASVIEAAREPLTTNGLSVIQGLSSSDNALVVTTRLLHTSGEWIEESLAIPLSKMDAQGVGSASTYGRRYALAAMVGLAQVDDDGNDAAARGNATTQALTNVERPISGKQVAVDAFSALPEEEQNFLRDEAIKIIAHHESGGDPWEFVEAARYDTEEKLALWSLLPSAVRAAIKKGQQKVTA